MNTQKLAGIDAPACREGGEGGVDGHLAAAAVSASTVSATVESWRRFEYDHFSRTSRSAEISPCGRYRYSLRRRTLCT